MSILEKVIEIPAAHEGNVFGQFDMYAKNRKDASCQSHIKRWTGENIR